MALQRRDRLEPYRLSRTIFGQQLQANNSRICRVASFPNALLTHSQISRCSRSMRRISCCSSRSQRRFAASISVLHGRRHGLDSSFCLRTSALRRRSAKASLLDGFSGLYIFHPALIAAHYANVRHSHQLDGLLMVASHDIGSLVASSFLVYSCNSKYFHLIISCLFCCAAIVGGT